MNSRIRQYLFGAIFIGVGIYYLTQEDELEALLYCLAGLCFVVNSLVSEPALINFRRVLTITTWVLIVITGLLFLWVIQFKYF